MHHSPGQWLVGVDGVGAQVFDACRAQVACPFQAGLDAVVGGVS